MPSLSGIYWYYREASRMQGKKVENFPNCKNEVHSMASCGNPVDFFFKISPHHVNMDVPWVVGMIKTIKLPLETLLMTPWKWPIWVILHCKNCTSQNFRTEGGHHFFFTFFGFPSLILTIRSYPENFIASRKCKVTPSINTVAAWVYITFQHCDCCRSTTCLTAASCLWSTATAASWRGPPA